MAKRPERFLVILESPGKQKKIKEMLGEKYIVRASFGHIRDLDSKKLSINIEDNFKPDYSVMRDKRKVVSELTECSKRCSVVYLASDLDREGESIAWHISETLKLPAEKTRRITFSEITKKAILKAIDNPGDIDMNLNNAQQARRIIDRLLGYKISPILWKHIKNGYKSGESLSAGRVQSVVSKIIIDREREIEKHASASTFKCTGEFKWNDRAIKCQLNEELKNREITDKFLDCNKTASYTLFPTTLRDSVRKPSAPFITSTLQQEVSSKYRMSPKATMAVAQKLYECGLITYMRTDSKILSGDCLADIEKYVKNEYGDDYHNQTSYTNDSKNAQEAHEAIRPCRIEITNIDEDDCYTDQEKRIYCLIWKRTVASQMAPCKVKVATNKVKVSGWEDNYFVSRGEHVTFPGFTRVYREYTESSDSEDDTTDANSDANYFENKKREILTRNEITATMKYSKPKQSRYTEASLVKQLEKLGIGRPSTYSNMVSIIQNRGYTDKRDIEGESRKIDILSMKQEPVLKCVNKEIKIGGERNKLVPTTIGKIVNDYLNREFPILLDYDFTNQLENSLDRISRGEVAWHKIVKRVYNIFRERIDLLGETKQLAKHEFERTLEDYPEGSYRIYIAKYGPVVCLTTTDGKRKFAPIRETEMDSITYEEIKKLFEYPKNLGEFKRQEVELHKGKFGLYIKYNGNNFSIRDPENIPETLEEAKVIILAAELTRKNPETNGGVLRVVSDEIVIKSGKFGNYIQYQGKNNVSMGKNFTVEQITEAECLKLVSEKKKKYNKK